MTDEFDAGSLEGAPDLLDGIEVRRDRRILQRLDAADGRDRDAGLNRQFVLLPANQRPCGPDLPDNDQHVDDPELQG